MDEILNLLEKVPVFFDLNKEQLISLQKIGEVIYLNQDDCLFQIGQQMEYMYVILAGEIEVTFKMGQQSSVGNLYPAGTISGVLPYSRLKTSMGNGIAKEPSTIFTIHRRDHHEIEKISYPLMQSLVGLLTDRVRETTRMQQQNEKLMALGKLSAGLSHELNNPISSIVRNSSALKKHLSAVPDKFKKVLAVRLDEAKIDAVNDLLFSKIGNAPVAHFPLAQRAQLEETLGDWMEAQNIDNAYCLAENFAEARFSLAELEYLKQNLNDIDIPSVLEWMDNVLSTEKLVNEIEEASHRISALIHAVKTYSYMDKAHEKEPTDLVPGITSTITMLQHKLKSKNIKVAVQLPEVLPKVNIYPGEINQVWTNLIDNAIDAVPEGGEIKVMAKIEKDQLVVTIQDNGPGIPTSILNQIFDPFFTTKDVGKGTGLGLDIVRKIMSSYKGDVKVNPSPGLTQFLLYFPLT